MKILFLNQFFWPDTAATGQLLCDLTDYLSTAGESVDVVCGSANYGRITGAPEPKANIFRLKNSAFSRKVAGRMGSYLSFLVGALWQSMRLSPPDVVVTLTTPPLLSLVGLMIQKFRGAKHIIWEMDVYPDVAIDLGVLKENGLAAKLFGWLADLPRRHADRVIVLGECMRTRLLRHGIAGEKIVVAENWADSDHFTSGEKLTPPSFPLNGGLSVLYSGNFGLAHDPETISKAMLELNSRSKGPDAVRFVFAGGGTWHGWLRNFSREHALGNVVFQPYCERQELGARLASGHIGLVTQKAESLGSAVPSKTYGIMAAGRPILFIGPKDATPARIIERYGCGWQIDCGDVRAVVELLELLNEQPDLVVAAGNRAYAAFIAHYQRSVGVARIASILGSEREAETPARQTQSWAKGLTPKIGS
ncbi:MAG: glycosyltransferase WbuB [Bryobacterales bacterium]|nr:glycosyltransferase WbuB [Bryobacterales bacterium]